MIQTSKPKQQLQIATKTQEEKILDKIEALQLSQINEFETQSNYHIVLQQLKMKTMQTKSRLDNMTK